MNVQKNQQWDPASYDRHARFVSDLGGPVLDLLDAAPRERILDLGCGDGPLTLKLVRMGCDVLGVDASAAMVDGTRKLGVSAIVMDGQALTFQGEFDAVFSNAALHWMPDADKVIAGVWNALKPGGRFVAEFGGHGNVETIVRAAEAALQARGLPIARPWFFPTAERYQSMLENQGFQVTSIALIPRPTPLPGDVGQWLTTFAQPFLRTVSEEHREDFVASLVEDLRPTLLGDDGLWRADYVRLRCRAVRPALA